MCINGPCKTPRDRFRKLIVDQRSTSKTYSGMSGITENVGERELLLEDIIQTMNDSN